MSPFRATFPYFYFEPPLSTIIRDEQRNYSTFRILLYVTVAFTFYLIQRDAKHAAFTVPSEAYVLLGGLLGILAVGAFGPRIAQYLGPQLGGIASGIASAAQGYAARQVATGAAEMASAKTVPPKPDAREPDPLTDDER